MSAVNVYMTSVVIEEVTGTVGYPREIVILQQFPHITLHSVVVTCGLPGVVVSL